jgi:hypothetical protein
VQEVSPENDVLFVGHVVVWIKAFGQSVCRGTDGDARRVFVLRGTRNRLLHPGPIGSQPGAEFAQILVQRRFAPRVPFAVWVARVVVVYAGRWYEDDEIPVVVAAVREYDLGGFLEHVNIRHCG